MKALAALLLILTASLAAGASLLRTAAVQKFAARSAADFREREAALAELCDIAEELSALIEEEADYYGSRVLLAIAARHRGLVFEDVSSGVRLDFMRDEDLMFPAFETFFFKDGAASFIARRNLLGLTSDRETWRSFLSEEGFAGTASYGWLGTEDADTFAYRKIASVWETADPEALFPLVNGFSRINVNTAHPGIFAPLMKTARISGDRAGVLKARLAAGPVNGAELKALLGVPPEHGVYRTFGVKTAFWRVRFPRIPEHTETPRYLMEGIIAAIPERGKNRVEQYRLVEWRLINAL
ncbi:MAG: hypothetical protein LBN92_00870 [Treponema sp.]|nr:hypothetical protein [Treponema sp.]